MILFSNETIILRIFIGVENIVKKLEESKKILAEQVVSICVDNSPECLGKIGEKGKEYCFQDIVHHFEHLIEAIKVNYPKLFSDYLIWTSKLLEKRGVSAEDFKANLTLILKVIENSFDNEFYEKIVPFFNLAQKNLDCDFNEVDTYITIDNPLNEEANKYLKFLLDGERNKAQALIDQLISNKVDLEMIYLNIFQVTQYEIGRLWQENKITVIQEHYCTASTQLIISSLFNKITPKSKKNRFFLAHTLKGDLHELGARMLADFFEIDGWNTHYAGSEISNKQLINYLKENKVDVLAISITQYIYISRLVQLIKLIREVNELKKIKILVGGNLFMRDEKLFRDVNADGFANSANEAVVLANSFFINDTV